MERIPGVDLVSHQTWFGGRFQQEPKVFFMQNPVEPEIFLSMFPEFILPQEQKQKWLQTRTGAIVGRKTAERFHWKVGDKVPIFTPLWRTGEAKKAVKAYWFAFFEEKAKHPDPLSFAKKRAQQNQIPRFVCHRQFS